MAIQPTRPLILSALGYFVIGAASAEISNPVEAPGIQAALRLTALFLGAVVFLVHVRHEIVRLGNSLRRTALRAAAAAALGGLLLAVAMVLYNVLVRSRPTASVALVLVVWPLVTGALGFLAAAVAARIIAWWQGSRRPR